MSSTPPAWQGEAEQALGEEIESVAPVAGGDIGHSYCARLASGDRVFIKHYRDAPHGVAASEAQGLRWLAEGDALPVARTRASGERWLALDWIEEGEPSPDFEVALGRGLAALHAAAPETFGLDGPNWIGPLPQDNQPAASWSEFYAERRIRPLTERARREALLDDRLFERLGTLLRRLPDLVGPEESPARLHGDLWSGNVLVDEHGRPCLIDPAVYAGNREVDLAMMRLFGGFGRATFDAYAEAFPLATGHETRVSLYQVYPLLVHVCLFGRSYAGRLAAAVEDALD